MYFCTVQSISFYIAYLLTKHEFVIVPGLGAFIVSGSEVSKEKRESLLCPPKNFLGFNPDIQHNDGLLANAIANGAGISYKEACLRIHQYVTRITGYMENQTSIQLPWIGELEFSAEGKILFTPFNSLSCNVNTFGMDNFYMSSVQELNVQEEYPSQTDDQSERQPSIVRRYLSIAAAIIGLLMIAIPVSDHATQQFQTANILSLPVLALSETEFVQPLEELKEEPEKETIRELLEELAQEPIAEPAQEPMEESTEEITPYYIVISSLPTKSSAQVQMTQIKKEGFSTADIVSSGNKHRIYVAKFSDKTEANTFLARFRTQYPQYHDAWLLIQRI